MTEDGITIIDLQVAGDPKVTKTIKLDAPVSAYAGAAAEPDAEAGVPATDGGTDGDAAVPDDAQDAGADTAPRRDAEAGPATPPGPAKADVSITPTGRFAGVRRDGSRVVTVVDLTDGSRWSWTLSGPVTDLDLADTGDRAVAVVRSESRVAILPVPGIGSAAFDDVVIAGETIGSVVLAPKGSTALLYTNALPVNRLTVLQLAGAPRYDVVDLHAPVLSVVASPTAQHAIVIHNPLNGEAFKSAGAFSVVPLSSEHVAVIQPTDAQPMSVAIAPAGDKALVPVRDDQKRVYGVYLASMPSLVTERFHWRAHPWRPGSSVPTARRSSPKSTPKGGSRSSTPRAGWSAPSPVSSSARGWSSGRAMEVNDVDEHFALGQSIRVGPRYGCRLW